MTYSSPHPNSMLQVLQAPKDISAMIVPDKKTQQVKRMHYTLSTVGYDRIRERGQLSLWAPRFVARKHSLRPR